MEIVVTISDIIRLGIVAISLIVFLISIVVLIIANVLENL